MSAPTDETIYERISDGSHWEVVEHLPNGVFDLMSLDSEEEITVFEEDLRTQFTPYSDF